MSDITHQIVFYTQVSFISFGSVSQVLAVPHDFDIRTLANSIKELIRGSDQVCISISSEMKMYEYSQGSMTQESIFAPKQDWGFCKRDFNS